MSQKLNFKWASVDSTISKIHVFYKKKKYFIQSSSACLFMKVETGNVFELTLCYCSFRYNRFHQVHQVNSRDLSSRLNVKIEWSINLLHFWTDLKIGHKLWLIVWFPHFLFFNSIKHMIISALIYFNGM